MVALHSRKRLTNMGFPLLRRIWYRARSLLFYYIVHACAQKMTALTQQNIPTENNQQALNNYTQ